MKMDSNFIIDAPNKVADVYRNYRPIVMPFVVEKRLDFIDISEDGHTILGSSSLSGRYWRGSVWCFKSATCAPKKEDCITGIECDTSVSDGKFLDKNKLIIVGEDSGAVTIYELTKDEDDVPNFAGKGSRNDHDSCVLTISVSSDKTNVTTAGMDLCIKVWEVQGLITLHTYHSAHSHHITKVAYSNDTPNMFASCGLDGAALLWDTRQPKPATVLIDDPQEGLTALAWQKDDANTVAVGSNFGAVSLVDVRTCSIKKKSIPFHRPLFNLLSINASSLAACADSHEVKVVDPESENLSVRYVDERHSDFVRGLSYDEKAKTLFSCGWDKEVLSHDI